jgi:uncharacterized protein (DUF302 family)
MVTGTSIAIVTRREDIIMSDYGRRIVLDQKLDGVVDALNAAIRAEGLTPLGTIDVREHFARHLSHDFRRYTLVHAWSAKLAMEALRHSPDAGTQLLAIFAVYELGDGETVVVANPPFASLTDDYQWRKAFPVLASIADREIEKVARIVDRIAPAAVGQPGVA